MFDFSEIEKVTWPDFRAHGHVLKGSWVLMAFDFMHMAGFELQDLLQIHANRRLPFALALGIEFSVNFTVYRIRIYRYYSSPRAANFAA